jgi:hypothetical protein
MRKALSVLWVALIIISLILFATILITNRGKPSEASSLPPHSVTMDPKTGEIKTTIKPALEVSGVKAEVGEFGVIFIVGKVRNNSQKAFSYVQVEINLYDKEDTQVGSTMANINNLAPGGIWRFMAPVTADNVNRYEVIKVTGF